MAEAGVHPHQPLVRSSKRKGHTKNPRKTDLFQRMAQVSGLSNSPQVMRRPGEASTLPMLQPSRPTISRPANAEGEWEE